MMIIIPEPCRRSIIITSLMCANDLNRKSDQKQIINITSRVGSVADNSSGKNYSYRMSKAAMNISMFRHDLPHHIKIRSSPSPVAITSGCCHHHYYSYSLLQMQSSLPSTHAHRTCVAVNKNLSIELGPEGFTCTLLHPGQSFALSVHSTPPDMQTMQEW